MNRNFFSSYRGYNREVWFLLLISLLTRLITYLLLPFTIVYLGKIGMNPTQIGWIMGSIWILGAFSGPIIGFLSDQYSQRMLYVIVMIVWLLSFFGFAFFQNFYLLLLISLVNGLGLSCIDPILLSRMYLLVDESKRVNISQLNYIAFNAGAMIGPFVGTELSKSYGQGVFVASGCIFFILLLLDPFFQSKRVVGQIKKDIPFKESMTVLGKDTALRWYIVAGLIFGIGYIQLDSTLPLVLNSNHLMDWYAPFCLVNAIAAVVITTPLMNWAEKKPISSMIRLSSIFTLLGFLCFIYTSIPLYFIGFAFITLAEIIFYPLWREAVSRLNPTMQGTYLGSTNLIYLGFFLGSVLGGKLFATWNQIYLFLFFGLIGFTNFFVFQLGQSSKNKKSKIQEQPAAKIT